MFGCIASDTNDWLPEYSTSVPSSDMYQLPSGVGERFPVSYMRWHHHFVVQWQRTVVSSLNGPTNSAYLERESVWRYVTSAAIQELLYHCNGQSMACAPIHSTMTTQLLPINTNIWYSLKLTANRGIVPRGICLLDYVLKKQNIHIHM